jgi:hypothetical protein
MATAATPAYINAGWAWIKALLGISVFEASLELSASTREVEQLSRQLVAGHDVLSQLTVAGRTERGVLWVLFAVPNRQCGAWSLAAAVRAQRPSTGLTTIPRQ